MSKIKLVPEMEGATARWYARQRASKPQLAAVRRSAAALAAELPDGAHVLEVAPGPGYHAIELARTGRLTVTGLDISRTFVELATAAARTAGVAADFRHGDVADMPLAENSFDLVVCQAAFKNFTEPVRALDEMHRVLRPGGVAVIEDLRRDATPADIAAEVDRMALGRGNAALTRWTLGWLRRRAHSRAEFERLAARSRFGSCTTEPDGVQLRVRLEK